MKGYLCFLFLLAMFIFPAHRGECLSNPEKIYSQVSLRAARTLEKEFGIHNCGATGKANKSVELIRLNFLMNREVDRDDARKILFPIVNRLIAVLNADEYFRPYMSKYPFNEDDVEVSIFFKTKDGEAVYHPYIHMAALKRGKFKYATLDKKDPYPYEDVVYETITEARKKMKGTL